MSFRRRAKRREEEPRVSRRTVTFIASLYYWSPLQYEQQWLTALRRVVEGANRSVLITSYVEPPLVVTSDDYLVWWPLYRAEDVVYVQNQMLFFKTLKAPFSIECPWEFVRDRQALNAEGVQVSEWVTNVQSIRECLNRKLDRK